MIITQKYNSAADIDPEFIPDLEKLLSDCVPSFEMIKQNEQKADDSTHFAYYLFFGQKTNAPIGFAQININIEKDKSKKTFFSRFKKKPLEMATLNWSMPGCLKEGIIFDPQYIQHACPKAQSIFEEYQQREDVKEQELLFSSAYTDLTKLTQESSSDFVAESLVKNRDSYQDYMQSLSSNSQKDIRSAWKEKKANSPGDYEHFKEAFAYKTEGSDQYKNWKSETKVQTYLELGCPIEYLTVENKDKVLAMVFFFEGRSGNAFYDIIFSEISDLAGHQLAILKFFEKNQLHRLHYLGEKKVAGELIDLGFTKREQFRVKAQKVLQ